MGLTFSSIFQQLFGKKQMRILMVGLDAAGKFDAFFLMNTKHKLFNEIFFR